jgi:type II secretory pathway component PulF
MNSSAIIMADHGTGLLPAMGSIFLYALFFLAPVAALAALTHKLLSLPLRRRERARLFLDLIETALSQGKPLEQMLISVSASRDPSPGVRFHLFAAHLENGLRFSQALQRVPRLVPPQILGMLNAGEHIGDLSKVMPACRQLLNDGVSQTRGALNYLLILAFIVTPFTITIPLTLNTLVLPKFKEVFVGLAHGTPLPAFTQFVFSHSGTMLLVQSAMLLLIWFAMIAYIGGPRVTGWVNRILPGVPDRIFHWLPWRHKRLQRDFSSMLAILLDSGVPETDAVALAAQATTNRVLRERAAKVGALLSGGVKLPNAIRAMDDSGELRWRLANTFERGRNFVRSLTGWHEALDAKAFQLEQSAAQITTTSLVILNGFIVACVMTAVFLALTDLISEAALW